MYAYIISLGFLYHRHCVVINVHSNQRSVIGHWLAKWGMGILCATNINLNLTSEVFINLIAAPADYASAAVIVPPQFQNTVGFMSEQIIAFELSFFLKHKFTRIITRQVQLVEFFQCTFGMYTGIEKCPHRTKTKMLTHNWPEQIWPIAHLCIPSSDKSYADCAHLTHENKLQWIQNSPAFTRAHVAHHKIALNFVLLDLNFGLSGSQQKRERERMISADQSMLINLWDWNWDSCVCACVRAERRFNLSETKGYFKAIGRGNT